MTVSQMAAVRKIHSKNGVPWLQSGHVDGHVGGSAGVCLNVGVLRAEEFLGAINRQLFDFIGVFAAAVIALAGVTLGVLIREDGAHGFEDGFGDEILGGNQFQASGLAFGLFTEQIGDLQ